jgi:uncharacterized protein YoxC
MMKKILAIALCLVVLCFPISVYAEETTTPVETTTTTVETPVEDPVVDGEDETTPPNDIAPDGDESPEGDTPVEDKTEDAPVEDEVAGETPSDETVDNEDTLAPEDVPTDTPVDDPVDTPIEEPTEEPTDTPVDTPTDDVVDTPVETPEDNTPTDVPPVEETPVEEEITLTESIAKWLENNADTISLIISIIGAVIVIVKRISDVLKKAGIINDNAVTIATESASQMQAARETINNAANVVTGYNEQITALLSAFSTLLDENKLLKDDVNTLKNYLHTSTNANLEFSNELAELLALSNIPNYKKDEIGQRHLESVQAILDAEALADVIMSHHNPVEETPVEEVKENDGEEA